MSGGSAAAEGGSNRFVYVVAAVSALGGLLFGYDTGIISGASLFIEDDFRLSDTGQQVLVTSLLLEAVFGAFAGGPLSDRVGRRRAIMVASAAATGWWSPRTSRRPRPGRARGRRRG